LGLVPEVFVEEHEDPPPGVLRGRVVVVESRQVQEWLECPTEVETVHEAVPGVRVLLDVVRDPQFHEGVLEPIGASSERAIAAAIARHDRSCAAQPLDGVPRNLAVVDRGCGEVVLDDPQSIVR
jgi:hypothetical protein